MEGTQDGDHMANENLIRAKQIVQSSLIDSFSMLESCNENYRVNAGFTLINCLHQKQLATKDDLPCSEITYSLKRLIRGLATSNASKRAGYFSVLVEILKLFSCVTLKDVLAILETQLHSGHNSTNKEKTEIYTGQTLVFGALIHSNFIFEESKSAQADLLGKLFALCKKKKNLLQYGFSFLIDFIQKTDAENFQNTFWPLLKCELNKSWEEYSVDHIYLLLISKKQFPKVVKKYLVERFGSKDIINKGSVHPISKLLLKLPIIVNHPVYDMVAHCACSSDSAVLFWESFVNECERQPTKQKEEVLLNSLEFLLQHLPNKKQIPELLLDNFMGAVIKTFQNKKTKVSLAQKYRNIFKKMLNVLISSEVPDEVRISFIQRILFYPGTLTFEKLTDTKIVSELLSHMKIESIEEIAKVLREIISASKPKMKNEGMTRLWSKPERIYATQLYSRLLQRPVTKENIKWKLKQFKFLITFGLIASPSHETREIDNTAVSMEAKSCFFKALGLKDSKDMQLVTLLTSIIYHLNDTLFIRENPSKLRQSLSESSIAAWKKLIDVVKEIENIDEETVMEKRSKKQMFLILFLHMGLQLFNNAPLAEEFLEELHVCYEKTNNTDLKTQNKKPRDKNGEDKEPYWVEVIVDLLLSLLSHSSHMLRNFVGVVFPHLCPHLTPSSVHQILQVLDPHGKQPLSNTDTEDDSDDDVNKKSPEDESEKESGGEEEEDDYDDDLDDDLGNAPVDIHLKMAVHNALKKAGGGCSGSDEESIDMDQMTEEEMDGLDAALSEAFKLVKHNQADQKRSNKQHPKDETLMHFRVRVIDLLELYLANEPHLAVALDMILPLFELLEFCIKDRHQMPLESRIRNFLKKLSGLKHFSNVVGVDQEHISVVLSRLLQKCERAAAMYQNMGAPLVQCSMFLFKTSCNIAQEDANNSVSKHSEVFTVYKEALITFFQQRDCLLPLDMFKLILIPTWKGSWKLAEEIFNFAFSSDIRPFRRHQALQLLVVFFSNCKGATDVSPKNLKMLGVMEKRLSENTINILETIVQVKESDSSVEVKEIFVRELLRVLLAIWQARNSCKKEGTASAMDWNAVGAIVSRYWEEKSLATDTKIALKKLASALQISLSKKNVKTAKRKAQCELKINEDSDNDGYGEKDKDDDDPCNLESIEYERSSSDTGDGGYESGNGKKDNLEEAIKKRKRPKNNNLKGKAILKKQLKEARIATMGKGLEDSFNFADIDISNLKEPGDEMEAESSKKEKRPRLSNGSYDHSGSSECSKKSKVRQKDASHTFPKHKKRKVSN